jgi:membrane peptidoglycan carboxypeptidase
MGKPKRADAASQNPAAAGAGLGKRKPPPKLWRRILLWSTVAVASLALIGTGVIVYAYQTTTLPNANSDFKTNTSFVYYNDGKTPIGSFQVQNRVTIPYATMPQTVKDAVVAAENRSFWTDPGISVTGLFRAALGLVGIAPADTTATGGGSTLTQQYIKIMYLTQERTFSRKATEILLAAKVGQMMTKEEILDGYLNTVYFGRGAYGIEAAAQAYYKKPAAKLDLAQSVAVCAIVNSPGNLDPASGTKQAADLLQRYQYTLNGMVEMGKITESQKAAIYTQLPKMVEPDNNSRLGGQTGFLLKAVENELLAKGFPDQVITGGGLKVITTFDKADQEAAAEVAKAQTLQAAGGNAKTAKSLHAGIASVDNATGGVLALYGGPDFVKNSRNWATTPRQTGSTFKPYTLTAALREGWTLGDKVSKYTKTSAGGDGRVAITTGPQVSLLQATTNSIDGAYFNLMSQLQGGPTAVAQAANDAGAPTGSGWYLDNYMPLGSPMISAIDQASAYSTFANLGVHRDWHVITQVQDASGKVVFAPDTTGAQTIEPEVAQDVTAALKNVTRSGTGRAASAIGYPVAGKTGTKGQPNPKNRYAPRQTIAAWFVGYTAQITTAVVYVKGDAGQSDLGASWFGAGPPAHTWAAYMAKAMQGKDRVALPGPTKRESTQTPTPSPVLTPTPGLPTDYPTPTVPAPTAPTTAPATQVPTTSPPSTPAASGWPFVPTPATTPT